MNRSGTAREKWTRIIHEQQASGETVAAFCAGRGIAESLFYPWKRRLAGRGGVRPGPPPLRAFVEAKIDQVEAVGGAGVAIELGRGRRVTVARGFDRRLLLEVIETLESSTGAAS
jgi:transposase-like protein